MKQSASNSTWAALSLLLVLLLAISIKTKSRVFGVPTTC